MKEDFGWPKKFDISPEKLAKYGYKDMHQFRNWRWFKALGGGPLSDLGAHQIDIFNWWMGMTPRSVMASGGLDYYKDHEWYDNVMVNNTMVEVVLQRPHVPLHRLDGQAPLINEYIIEKQGQRQLVLYWYQSHGRVIASEYWAKLYMVLDAIHLHRTDGALVRVTSARG